MSPLSMEFFRQEYWSGLPFPSPEIFPTQRLNPDLLHLLLWQVGSLHTGLPGKPHILRASSKSKYLPKALVVNVTSVGHKLPFTFPENEL